MALKLEETLARLQRARELLAADINPGLDREIGEFLERSKERLINGVDATLIAFIGPSGVGKSTLINALCGSEVAAASVKRPTTSKAHAIGASELLYWPRRLGIEETTAPAESLLDPQVILVDLPDIDSYAREHREITRQIGALADVVIWVIDPQKYADAVLFDEFLSSSPFRSAITVLTHADQLDPASLQIVAEDVAKLFAGVGIATEIFPCSAPSGDGIGALRARINAIAESKTGAGQAILARSENYLELLAEALNLGEQASSLPWQVQDLSGSEVKALLGAVSSAVGANEITKACGDAYRYRTGLLTAWLPLAWLKRLRPDPLKRLHLGAGKESGGADQSRRSQAEAIAAGQQVVSLPSLPPASAGARAQLSQLFRLTFSERTQTWPLLLRNRWDELRGELLPSTLELAHRQIGRAQLHVRPGFWAWPVAALQWLFLATALVGGVWLGAIWGASTMLIELPYPKYYGVPLPTLLLLGGLAAGIILAILTAPILAIGAKQAARRAEIQLQRAISQTVNEALVSPLDAELETYRNIALALARYN